MVAPEEWDLDLFFWRVTSDDSHPRIEAGDLLLVDGAREAVDGDVVLVRHDGRLRVGTLGRRGDEAQLLVPRPEIPPLRIPLDRFRPLGVVREIRRELGRP